MERVVSRIGIPVLLIVFFGTSVLLGAKTYQLKGIRTNLEKTLEDTENRMTALKQKYSEEKAKGDALQRAKLSADSRMRDQESAMKKLADELDSAKKGENEKIMELTDKVHARGKELEAVSNRNEQLKAEYTDMQKKAVKAAATIREKEGELKADREMIENQRSELKNAGQKIDRFVSDNMELSKLSQELLVEFDQRGAFSILLEAEPFTQVKRVALEKKIQEYLNRIDSATLSDTELK